MVMQGEWHEPQGKPSPDGKSGLEQPSGSCMICGRPSDGKAICADPRCALALSHGELF